jgi:hypothetical protein
MSAYHPSGEDMKFIKNLSKEFRTELFKAIRLSAFLTALAASFLVFQNRTANQEEIEQVTSRSPEAIRKCKIDPTGNRVPASVDTGASDRVDCRE